MIQIWKIQVWIIYSHIHFLLATIVSYFWMFFHPIYLLYGINFLSSDYLFSQRCSSILYQASCPITSYPNPPSTSLPYSVEIFSAIDSPFSSYFVLFLSNIKYNYKKHEILMIVHKFHIFDCSHIISSALIFK
jgi:hypothetical protein